MFQKMFQNKEFLDGIFSPEDHLNDLTWFNPSSKKRIKRLKIFKQNSDPIPKANTIVLKELQFYLVTIYNRYKETV